MTICSLKNSKGFTLIEAALILLIFGIILAGVYVTFNSVNKERKLSDSRRQITDMVSGARDYFSGHNTATGQGTSYTVPAGSNFMREMRDNAQIFPNDAGCTTGATNITCRNLYNGNYTLALIDNGGRFQLVVQTTNLPQEACMALVTGLGGAPTSQQQTGFVGFSTGATISAPTNFPGTTGITPANAATLCTPPANTNAITLNLAFRL